MMREPAHRTLSFRANSFARFAKKYRITVETAPFDPYGLVDNSTLKESQDFLVNLTKDGRIYSFTLTFDEYRTTLPTVEDVLEYIANDAAIVEGYKGDPEGFAKLTDLPIANAARLILQASEISEPFKAFMGPEAYYEMVQITEERG
jgi:hypothetical protein